LKVSFFFPLLFVKEDSAAFLAFQFLLFSMSWTLNAAFTFLLLCGRLQSSRESVDFMCESARKIVCVDMQKKLAGDDHLCARFFDKLPILFCFS
jgi:hypothetical protein